MPTFRWPERKGVDPYSASAKAGYWKVLLLKGVQDPNTIEFRPTREAMDRMAVNTVRNILGVLDGQPNRDNAVNPEVFG